MWQSESVRNTICKNNSEYDSRAVAFPEKAATCNTEESKQASKAVLLLFDCSNYDSILSLSSFIPTEWGLHSTKTILFSLILKFSHISRQQLKPATKTGIWCSAHWHNSFSIIIISCMSSKLTHESKNSTNSFI